MPLTHILKNKLQLQKHFHLQEWAIDNWPFWLLEENVRLVNEIIEEEENNRKKQEGEQTANMPDTGQMMKNMSNMGSNFNIPKF
jgi:hypothetical protein